MLEFIGELFMDVSLFVGIILLALSFSKKFRRYRSRMLVASVALIAVGIIFFDSTAVSEAYQSGKEAAQTMMLD